MDLSNDERAVFRPLNPIYLQFLDRELSETLKRILGPEEIDTIVRALALGTDAQLYCGLSALYEHPSLGNRIPIIEQLIQTGHLDLMGHHSGFETFIASRQALYSHDYLRYPLYFSSDPPNWEPSRLKAASATELLIGALEGVVGGRGLGQPERFAPSSDARRAIQAVLSEREGQAITSSLFSQLREPVDPVTMMQVRLLISSEYTVHQLEQVGGVTTRGVDGFDAFDRMMGQGAAWCDVGIVRPLLHDLGLDDLLVGRDRSTSTFWEEFLHERPSGALGRLLPALIFEADREVASTAAPSVQRRLVLATCRRRLASGAKQAGGGTPQERLESAARLVGSVIGKARGAAPASQSHPLAVREADVLLITATEVEALTVQAALGGGGSIERRGDLTFTKYGLVGASVTWHIDCAMGSSTTGGALLTTASAIREISPRAVVMPGVCFGVDADKTPIADVIVADHLLDYSLLRASTTDDQRLELECRGDRVPASPGLVQLARALARGNRSIHLGLLVSGPVLIDHAGFRDSVLAMPEARGALGGEMEGQGLFAAAYTAKTDWLVVKAVCDFADGKKGINKSERQRMAANASASFVAEMVKSL